MEVMTFVWLGVICASLIVEAVNAGTLVSIWFSAGAVVPLGMSFVDNSSTVYIVSQILVFGVVTALCIVFLRKIAIKYLYNNKDSKTNLDLVVGKKVKISKKYENIPYVKFNGIEYSVLEENEEILEIEDSVEIIKFEGNKIIVKKVK